MERRFKYMYAIIIDGNFMKGKVYYSTKKEAYDHLESEILEGYKKLKNEIDRYGYSYEEACWSMDIKDLVGVDGSVWIESFNADDIPKYITYKISRVKVLV